ncbi:MAG: 4a-hydroxytetrahydrobiopterin dehydratase [Myxococcales bacterium]|nr:4a-hydroxytetrahydrobiopterin dehydratase [Myxococcales bacterium]
MLPLSKDQIAEAARRLPAWTVSGHHITRKAQFRSYGEALVAVNRMAAVAERHEHHPDLEWSYRTLTVRLTTHDAGGLTLRDFDLAADLDPILGGGP